MKTLGVIYALLLSCVALATPYLNLQPPLQEKYIQLSTGVKLEYVEQGDANGTPIIFLHGITDSWHSYESTLPYLPSSLHAFAISQRGHGDSERPETGYTPRDFAADVAAFIHQKQLGPVIIVGHSMGGVHAQQFAISYPQLTKALVILGSDARLIDNKGMLSFFAEVMSMSRPFTKEYMIEFQNSTIFQKTGKAFFDTVVNEGMKCPLPVFQQALKGILEADMREDVKKVNVPSLVLWGDKDFVCTEEGQNILRKSLRSEEWKMYKNTGHALHWEQPEKFAKDLIQFINKL